MYPKNIFEVRNSNVKAGRLDFVKKNWKWNDGILTSFNGSDFDFGNRILLKINISCNRINSILCNNDTLSYIIKFIKLSYYYKLNILNIII